VRICAFAIRPAAIPFLVDLKIKKIYNNEDCEYTKSGGFNLPVRLNEQFAHD
jgi:hypothetical protein